MTAPVAIAEELLTESQAVARIPGRDAEVRAWLRGLGIARRGPTKITLYRWSEILSRIPLVEEEKQVEAAPQRPRLRRSAAI